MTSCRSTNGKKTMPFFYYIAKYVTRVLMLILLRWHVRGRENIPREGPLIVVCNHLHNADPPLLSAILPRRLVFMAKEELFRNPVGRIFVAGFGAFPVHRSRVDREALRRAEEVLQKGLALGLFPEGTRSPTRQLQEALPGSALIALRSKSPILPVGIAGTEKIGGAFWFLKRPVVTVNIGKPFRLPESSGQVSREKLKSATDMIMAHIAELLPEAYRGIYRNLVQKNKP